MNRSKYLDKIIEEVSESKIKIILPEFKDERVKSASEILKSIGLNVLDISTFNEDESYIKNIKTKRFTKNWTESMLIDYVKNPLIKALTLLDMNQADCVVAGSLFSSAEVIKSAMRIIGLNKQSKWISSCFFMIAPDESKVYTYADCGVIPEPNSNQLASIAYNAAKTHELIANELPKLAFLSFSTDGSSEHYTIKKVKEAVSIFKKKYPEILCEGEIQFDAAIKESIAFRKNKNSILKGEANVFIFPDLNAGNIAYKITQYLAGYSAWGPLLQGLNKPVHDLSRGCNVDDIVSISLISALESKI